jgi:transcriptional regulator with XRE-family HTH domain
LRQAEVLTDDDALIDDCQLDLILAFTPQNWKGGNMSKIQARGRRGTDASARSNGFGERLASTRELREMSRKDLALAANISESGLCRLEVNPGGSTEAETIFRLARALGVRPEWLWHGIEPMDLTPADRRIAELRRKLENAEVEDPQLDQAIRKGAKRYHPAIIAVANTFARNGERHTVDGWIARLEEVTEKLSPLLPG